MVIQITGYLPILYRIGSEKYLGAVLCFKMVYNILLFGVSLHFIIYKIRELLILSYSPVDSGTFGCTMTVLS